ncbi:Di-copper centre-containing protein, partial [Ramicandelaber brevisporus]
CSRVLVRKEIRSLTPAELNAYIAAATKLEQETANNAHDWLTAVHLAHKQQTHSTSLFFPWHRWMMNLYQIQLHRIDPNVTLPYWDWSADAHSMESAPVFSIWGGNGLASYSSATDAGNGAGGGMVDVQNPCIADGPLANVIRAIGPTGTPHCLSRNFNAGNTIYGVYDHAYMINLVQHSATFNDIWRGVENGPHSAIHYGIGSTMATLQSPNDPIFFLHHTFVDKLWDDWQ